MGAKLVYVMLHRPRRAGWRVACKARVIRIDLCRRCGIRFLAGRGENAVLRRGSTKGGGSEWDKMSLSAAPLLPLSLHPFSARTTYHGIPSPVRNLIPFGYTAEPFRFPISGPCFSTPGHFPSSSSARTFLSTNAARSTPTSPGSIGSSFSMLMMPSKPMSI